MDAFPSLDGYYKDDGVKLKALTLIEGTLLPLVEGYLETIC